MIRGYFFAGVSRRRPTIDAAFQFPTWGDRTFEVRLLVDTGADRTIIAPSDVVRLQAELDLDLGALPPGPPSRGVGGQTGTRTMQAVLTLGMVLYPSRPPTIGASTGTTPGSSHTLAPGARHPLTLCALPGGAYQPSALT